MSYMDAYQCSECGEDCDANFAHNCPADPREVRLEKEMARQRSIYRVGTDEAIIRRAAINALMERGDY